MSLLFYLSTGPHVRYMFSLNKIRVSDFIFLNTFFHIIEI